MMLNRQSKIVSAVKRSAGVAHEVYMINPLRVGDEGCKRPSPGFENSEQTSAEGQNRAISGPTKSTDALHN